jgi:excisionase family DNA binding protein
MNEEQSADSPTLTPAGDDEELLTLDEAIQFLGTSRPTLYRVLGQGELKGLKVGRQWRFRKADLIAYMERGPVAVAAAPNEALRAELDFFGEELRRIEAAELPDEELDRETGEGKIALLVSQLVALAIGQKASDIHLEPARQGSDACLWLRYRIDGVLHEIRRLPLSLYDALIARFKQLAEMNIAERRLPQDGRFQVRCEERAFELRMSSLPTLYGEALVMRILDRSSVLIGLERLGMTEEDRARLTACVTQPSGLILTTGPTGSGKTTLLYSCLHQIANPQRKTLTVENPVEYVLPYTTQAQVSVKDGMRFATALRSFLRQDPDIVMTSEMRDLETAELVVETALTGHLVLSSLHTDDAPSATIRFRDMGIEPFLIAATLRCVVAQRLIRTICSHCKEPAETPLPAPKFAQLRRLAAAGGYAMPPDTTFYRGTGCERCRKTGYRGRMGLFEVMKVDSALADAITLRAPVEELTAIAVAGGMRTLLADGVRKAVEGCTTLDEVIRAVGLRL